MVRCARGPYQSGNELPHSKEPTGVGHGEGGPSVSQPRLRFSRTSRRGAV